METRADSWLLWPRAICVGALAVGFGVVGHVSADGLLPGPIVLVLLVAFLVLLSAPLLTRPATPLLLIVMLAGGQTLVHLVLTLAAGHRGDPAAAVPPAYLGAHALPVVDGHRVGSLQDAYQGMSGQESTLAPALPVGHLANDMASHAPMMAVHLLAAALVGLWLARGERHLWTVIALTGARVRATASLFAPTPAAVSIPAVGSMSHTPAVPVSRWQARPHSRRGPPLLLV